MENTIITNNEFNTTLISATVKAQYKSKFDDDTHKDNSRTINVEYTFTEMPLSFVFSDIVVKKLNISHVRTLKAMQPTEPLYRKMLEDTKLWKCDAMTLFDKKKVSQAQRDAKAIARVDIADIKAQMLKETGIELTDEQAENIRAGMIQKTLEREAQQ